MPHSPLISLIIPVFNAENYIARCLDSALNQTLANIEIIIVDDCGADNSIAIAKSYAKRDSRIKIVRNRRNLGTFATRKAGILRARAEYCMFADPDDYLLPNACEIALNLITHTRASIAHLGIEYEPKNLKRVKPIIHRGILRGDKMRKFLNNSNNLQSLCDKIIATSVLKRALERLDFINRPLIMLEDGLLVLVASLECELYAGDRACIYRYCANVDSITQRKDEGKMDAMLENLGYLLEITARLSQIYPQHAPIIESYRAKVAATLIIQAKDYDYAKYYEAKAIIAKYGQNRAILPCYVASVRDSLRLSFRWQNLARLVIFVLSFGRVRI